MSEALFVRQTAVDTWHWCRLTAETEPQAEQGTEHALQSHLDASQTIVMILPGQQAAIRRMSIDGVDKKHLGKLLPYELEEQLTDAVEDLHFSFGPVDDEHINVLYHETALLQQQLDALLAKGADVQQMFVDFTLLDCNGAAAVMLLEGSQLLVKFADGLGFALEVDIATLALQKYSEAHELTGTLRLYAPTEAQQQTLRGCLPEGWTKDEAIDLDEQLATYWQVLGACPAADAPNLRNGAFGRQLPFDRWWRVWKNVTYIGAAAFMFALVVTYGDYLAHKNEGKKIRQHMQQAYLSAVPNGRKGDEENRLRSMLQNQGAASSAPSNLMALLSGFSRTLAAQQDVHLSNFRYNGEQFELQVSIEVKGLGELGQFRDLLATHGLETSSPRTSRQGEIYQASMKILEKR